MRRIFKWVGGILGVLLILASIAGVFIYVKSGSVMNKKFNVPHTQKGLSIPSDSVSIAEGKRLALTRGCLNCHGSNGEGEVVTEFGYSSRLVAPNLTKSLKKYSVAELENIIRHCIRPDGTSTIVMPCDSFLGMSDKELEKILAYLNSLPKVDNELPKMKMGPMARFMIATGERGPFPAYHISQQESHVESAPKKPISEYGRYLVERTCAHCHGMNLMGNGENIPPLTMVAGYSKQQFKKLMETGKALGGRELDLMAEVSKNQFKHFTDREVEIIYNYLSAWSDSTR